MRGKSFLTLLAVAAVAASADVSPAAAQVKTKTQTVPAEVIFEHGARADRPGNCSAIVFVQWKDVPNTISAKAFYLWKGVESSKVGEPPFDDAYSWEIDYKAPAGSHRTQVGKGWGDGPKPNDCSETSARQKEVFGTQARVELTIEQVGQTEACAKALKALRESNKAVRKLTGRVRRASGAEKQALRAKLAKAKARRARAAARVRKEC